MAYYLSKLFGLGTQSSSDSQIIATGVHATGNSYVSCGDISVSVIGSPGKPPNPLHKFPACSKNFCGREDVLRQVKKNIILCEKEKTSFQRIVAIIGLGGMGKSEIAKVLAAELQSKYEYIFWFDAQTKISLDSDFQRLASILKIQWTSNERGLKSVLSDVYHSLAKNYMNGIFIFDNNEVLKAEERNFSLEEYLLPDSHCKKPVFLLTTRNPMSSERGDIKYVHLDPLSEKESQQCMLSILGIEKQPLTSSLKKGITSLVNMSEGHPLGLTLIGQGLYDEVKDSLLDETDIESRVRSYIKLLKDSGLKDIPGQSNYEENLQVITNLTIEKLLKKDKGKIAVELLNIVALLSPDDIHAGLVNGINCDKPFETHGILCPQFLWDDLETTVRSGLKVLLSSSLLKIDSKAYEDGGYLYKYDMIKIHRLIQQSVQKWLLRPNESMEPLQKILRFTEQSVLNLDHIEFLLQFCVEEKLAYLHPETCCLQILMMHREQHFWDSKRDYNVLPQVRDVLKTKRKDLSPNCSKTLFLFETYLHRSTDIVGKYEVDQLKRSIMDLSPELSTQKWVLQLVVLILKNLQSRHGPRETHLELVRWVAKNYTDGKEDTRPVYSLRYFILRHCIDICREEPSHVVTVALDMDTNRSCDWSKARELISKLYDCTSESQRSRFWSDLGSLIVDSGLHEKERKQLLQCLVTSPRSIFSPSSFQFSQELFIYQFIHSGTFHNCIQAVAKYPELTAILATRGFVSAFWDLTEYFFRQDASSCKYFNSSPGTFPFEIMAASVCSFLQNWCDLFVSDVHLYARFGEKLDSEVEDLLRCPWSKMSLGRLSQTSMEYCIQMFS